MDPLPRSTIDGSAARQVWKAAVRSVAMTASHSSGVMSRNGPTWVRPALLTRPSIRPKRSMTAVDEGAPPGRRRRGPPRTRAGRRRPTRPALDVRSPPSRDAVVVDGDGRARRGGLGRDLRADPAAAAGDEDDAVGQAIPPMCRPSGDHAGRDAVGHRRRQRLHRRCRRRIAQDERRSAGPRAPVSRRPAPARRSRTRAARSRAAGAARWTAAGSSSRSSGCRRSRRRRPRPARSMPSSVSRSRAPSASRSLAGADRRERRIAGQQRVDGLDAARLVEPGPCSRPAARRTRCRPPPDPAR